MSSKTVIYIGMIIGSITGGYIPVLFGAGIFSYISILFSGIGGILGIWIGLKLSNS